MKPTCFALLAIALAASIGSSPAVREPALSERQRVEGPAAVDPQHVQDQDTMAWKDYRPIPGATWVDATRKGERVFRVALVAVDFEDQPFVITMKKGSDLFGNPQVDPVKREQVPQFYADFWGKPGPLNHGHTIHEYWMEQSRGRVGIPTIDAFGPYRMPKKMFQYGLNEHGQQVGCPTDHTCNHRMEPDVDALWAADKGADIKKNYDIVLRIYAGYDETSVWQEFGEMKFKSKEDIPADWGNPDTTKPRWIPTRYVPWTTWKAGAQQWGLSSVRQGESSGTITHEIAHFAFRTGDNNNNPYASPYRRVGSGPWDIMDRGSFNGPGGPHRRWVVPAAEGASMPAGFMLRNRIRYKWLTPEQVTTVTRSELEKTGVVVATVTARAVDPLPGEVAGVVVALDGGDRTPKCDMNADPLCSGEPVWNNYTIEVVQRIGNDSFTPDNGVLIAKNKDAEGRSCGYNCFSWVIDAHPEDIKMVDFKKPDGTVVMRTVADYRQLNDALFHAGTNSGSAYEWKDEANGLHFYVIDVKRSKDGILSYQVGVRSLNAAAGVARGVTASTSGRTVTLLNGGSAWDIYRLSATGAQLANELIAIAPGGTAQVAIPGGGAATLTAVSESDARQRTQATVR
jgi:M6 family metalloprotease-like protein